MESSKTIASKLLSAIEDLKASKKAIHCQHAILGVQLSNLEARISSLETLLTDCSGTDRETKLEATSSDFGARLVKKPPDASAAATIKLTIMARFDDSLEGFMMKRSSPFRKWMSTWCRLREEKPTNILFLFNGRPLRADWTPEQLDMEDGDYILAEKRWI